MTAEPQWTDSQITLRGGEIPVQIGWMSQADLRFYPDNPRIYTAISRTSVNPSQSDIETYLSEMEHVKGLVQSIRHHGGLIDPVLVRGGDNMVLEGNSRLAAYRLLAQRNPIQWGNIKVTLLPADVSDADVFALLGEYHLKGKTEWKPFEKAGYYYRRHMNEGVNISTLAVELGETQGKVKNLIDVYNFMVEHNEPSIDRWSYYEEYLKNRAIGRARKENPSMDDLVVAKIRSGEIPRAIDIRAKLAVIAAAGGRPLNSFLRGSETFEDAFEMTGDRSDLYNRLNRFSKAIAPLVENVGSLADDQRKKCLYETRKASRLLKRLEDRLSRTR